MFQYLIKKIHNWTQPRAGWTTAAKGGDCVASSGDADLGRTDNPFHFAIYNASGGKIIQCWHYDKITDRLKGNLYVIHTDDDFTAELSMILTKESLSR